MTDRFPLEVCRRIIRHLQPVMDNATLISLSLTSRVLQPLAEQILYHTLYLVGIRSVSTVLASFNVRPVLATHPRQIYVHPSERRTSHHYWTQVAQILCCASPQLELLYVSTQEQEAAYAAWVLQSLHDADGLTVVRVPFWWSSEMAEFLDSDGARYLTRLEMGDTNPLLPEIQPNLRSEAASYLSILEAPPNAVCILVPGRPVTHVKIRLGRDMTLQMLPSPETLLGECLARSAAPSGVIALDIGDLTYAHHGETYSMEVVELAPLYLPHLKFIGRVNSPWTKDVLPPRLHKSLIRLYELHTIELVVTHMHPQVDVYWELAMASELRTFSTSLCQIVFYKGLEMHRWLWIEQEGDFVLGSHNDKYHAWGGV